VSTIPATTVKELRDMTGAGMMDCKRALEEAEGDLDKAGQLLRERGIAAAQKRAGREAKEGKVLARTHDARATIVAVGCETEPVSKNDEFLAFVERLLEAVDAEGPEVAERLEDERTQLVAKIGENVVVRGAARVEAQDGDVVSAYVHRPADKIGVVVRAKADPELARLLAMHISFANPRYARREEVPSDEVERERAIYEKLPEVGTKPEHIRPQIIDGLLSKRFFAASVLADQPWIHDDSKTVGQVLGEHRAEVREFVRFSLAE
jgi:elongation factor Ts